MKELTQKMMTESMKLAQFAQEPEVVKAQKELTLVMKDIDDMVKAQKDEKKEVKKEEKTE